jgi:transposase
MRYELSDHEWAVIKLMLPNKPRGVPRVNDRRGMKGIYQHCGEAHLHRYLAETEFIPPR